MTETSSLAEGCAALAIAAPGARFVEVGAVKHVLSHRELRVVVLSANVTRAHRLRGAELGGYDRLAWVDPDACGLGVSSLARKILLAAL